MLTGCASIHSGSGVVFNIFNNTFVAKSGASNNVLSLQNSGTVNLRNNIIHTVSQTALIAGMTINRDHNIWYGSNIPSCSGKTGEICGQRPRRFKDYANNDFSILSNSPAINAGANLGSLYGKYVAAGASWPNPTLGQRPTSGTWAISAYEYSTTPSTQLTSPVNLRVLP